MDPWQRVVKSTSDLLLSPTLHQQLHYSHASLLSHHTRLLFSLFFDFMCSSPSSRCLLLLLLLFSPFFSFLFTLGFWIWLHFCSFFFFFFIPFYWVFGLGFSSSFFFFFFLHFSRYFLLCFPSFSSF